MVASNPPRTFTIGTQSIFGNFHLSKGMEILEDFKHPTMVFSPKSSKTPKPMELDIFVPSLSLAFEYQGQHHYGDSDFFGSRAEYEGSISFFLVELMKGDSFVNDCLF